MVSLYFVGAAVVVVVSIVVIFSVLPLSDNCAEFSLNEVKLSTYTSSSDDCE